MFKGVAVQFRRRKFGGEAGDDRWHRRPDADPHDQVASLRLATSSLLLHRPTEVPLH
jgi:hypothetical protein